MHDGVKGLTWSTNIYNKFVYFTITILELYYLTMVY